MNPRLSIIILSWNSLPVLRPCLESLRPLTQRDDVELIWVDNGSSDGASDYVAENHPRAMRILLPGNRGVAAGRNEGLKQARGRYILILDDDTEATSEAIEALMRHLDSVPSCGIAACALRNERGELQDSFKSYPGFGVKVANVLRGKLGLKKSVRQPEKLIHPCYVIGACQMIRREVIERIGLLDDNIFYGPEDADFCIRARKAGYTIDYLPEVSILHHWRRITTRRLGSDISRRHIEGLRYFWRKHHRWF